MRIRILPHVCLALFTIPLLASNSGDHSYRAAIQTWRSNYEANLRKANGWLALAGLIWLKEGNNDFGTGADNAIVLPKGSAPEIAGTFIFHDGRTTLRLKQGVPALVNGVHVRTRAQGPLAGLLAQPTETPIRPDTSGNPDRITLGRLSMIVIHRGNRYGIRLWDNGSNARRQFQGTRWFPIQESFRVTALFTAYAQPKMIPILNVLGDTEQNPSPGYATFELAGKPCRLEPILEDDRLFFMIKDLTSGKQTYPAGRFLYASLPKDGKVILDFNQATNPPCAVTAYATCPLPPKQNHLPVAVTAGEQKPDNAVASH